MVVRDGTVHVGSPPLARGTAPYTFLDTFLHGITPACAGNSLFFFILLHYKWDHPRLRGEQNLFHRPAPCGAGSPPLARGTEVNALLGMTKMGITPACAGNRIDKRANVNRTRDHPRLRGEQTPYTFLDTFLHGITPACAGNSSLVLHNSKTSLDHPRLRGEQYAGVENAGKWMGSPPLARGTVGAEGKIQCRTGITPACAGNSDVPIAKIPSGKDHPRLRGEQISINNVNDRCEGSPPLARGTDSLPAHRARGLRITPACAGNSRKPTAATYPVRDHPRLRGEQALHHHHARLLWGSPPLARGTVRRYS